MICGNCNKEIEDEASFCMYCGSKVETFEKVENGDEELNDVLLGAETSESSSNATGMNSVSNVATKKPNRGILIAVVCVIIAAIGISVYMMPSNNYKEAKAAVDDIAYYYDNSVNALYLDSDTYDYWSGQMDEAISRFESNFDECNAREQQKLADYYQEMLSTTL